MAELVFISDKPGNVLCESVCLNGPRERETGEGGSDG